MVLVGSRVKQTADVKPSRSVCVTQDEFGNPSIKTFVSDDKQSCAVKLLEEFDRIHYNDMIRYIDRYMARIGEKLMLVMSWMRQERSS